MVAPNAHNGIAAALARTIGGDPRALPLIKTIALTDLREAVSVLGLQLIVTRTAAMGVLKGMNDATYSPEQAQRWASFVRRGYVAGVTDGPIRPLQIEYEAAWEEAIAAVVSRLDEIGDVVDGEVTRGEALDLLQLLGEP